MNIETFIRAQIETALHPVLCEITNDSAKHHGHAGDDGSGQTHFTLRIISPAFAGKTRVERQRMVHALLEEAFQNGLHALSLSLEAE